ncbi:MAG: hypothetical protein HYT81_05090 [Gemmatimonadetes bacterium]|nr:hypothetical protein [Gemmatimonadota bacterium]
MPVLSGLRRTVLAPAAVLLLPAYLSACFHYVPASLSPLPKPKTEVRVTLAKPMDITMGEFTLHDVTTIEGIVTETNSDTLGLVARWLRPRVGPKYDAIGGAYYFSLEGIGQLEQWRVSGKRTAVLLAAGVAVAAFFVELGRRALGGELTGPPTGDTQSVVAPR